MYLILLSLAVATAIALSTTWLFAGWIGGVLLGLVSGIATWILGTRRLQKRLMPAMQQVQRQVESGHVQAALETLEEVLAFGKWVPLLEGQLYGQMGILAYHSGDKSKARSYVERAGRRAGDAQMLLAAIRCQDGDAKAAAAGLAASAPFQRKHVLLHNVWAWILHKDGRLDDAIAALNQLLRKVPENDISRDNLLRLQNRQKMNMKSFGMPWFALGLERPPASMGELRSTRKGFREAPKQRKRG